jgi:hypothetical protein
LGRSLHPFDCQIRGRALGFARHYPSLSIEESIHEPGAGFEGSAGGV